MLGLAGMMMNTDVSVGEGRVNPGMAHIFKEASDADADTDDNIFPCQDIFPQSLPFFIPEPGWKALVTGSFGCHTCSCPLAIRYGTGWFCSGCTFRARVFGGSWCGYKFRWQQDRKAACTQGGSIWQGSTPDRTKKVEKNCKKNRVAV